MWWNGLFLGFVVKRLLKVCKPANNVILMGQCLKICEVTFCLKMADSIAIVVVLFSILMLNQLSRRRKMPSPSAKMIRWTFKYCCSTRAIYFI